MEGIFNRRYIRVKAMLALYAFDSANDEFEKGEKQMLKSMEQTYDLFLSMLWLLIEIVEVERKHIERSKDKKLITNEDLNPNLRLAENPVILRLENNRQYKLLTEQRKINLCLESDNIIKIWRAIRDDAKYTEYMAAESVNFQESREFIIYIFKNYIAASEVFLDLFEDKNIHWYDDVQLVSIQIAKLLSHIKPGGEDDEVVLPALYKDRKSDIDFVKSLYRKTILHGDELAMMISKFTKNWEIERIAKMDVLLMKMAMVEFLYFPSLPVKVSLNEYLEISKNYSTENSRVFINGVLDKLLGDLNRNGRIKKTGRGLINR